MSVAIHELETSQPHYEVSVDTVEELLLLNRALSTVIAEQRLSDNTNEHKLELAETLREQVGEDVVEVLSGSRPEDFRYAIEESDFVIEALEIAKQKEQAERAAQKVVYPEYAWLYDADSTYPAANNTRKNFFDL
jgi:hypothetical protein